MEFLRSFLVVVLVFWGLVALAWVAWQFDPVLGVVLAVTIPFLFYAAWYLWRRK